MRYYLIGSEGREVSFDIGEVKEIKNGTYAFQVNELEEVQNYYLRQLAGKQYISNDQLNWERVTPLSDSSHIIGSSEALKVYRGFKPSGASKDNPGSLITDMPGKVVKVLTTEGALVNEEDTLIILEAMKMENEVKAGVSGTVKAVHVKEGEALESGHLMVEIEELASQSKA